MSNRDRVRRLSRRLRPGDQPMTPETRAALVDALADLYVLLEGVRGEERARLGMSDRLAALLGPCDDDTGDRS